MLRDPSSFQRGHSKMTMTVTDGLETQSVVIGPKKGLNTKTDQLTDTQLLSDLYLVIG
jgi:hypothetical protein